MWSHSILHYIALKRLISLWSPNGEVGGHVNHYYVHTAQSRKTFHHEDPHMMLRCREHLVASFQVLFRESSCTVRATCMLISDASFSSALLFTFQNSVSRLFCLKQNASCHVLCICFSVQFLSPAGILRHSLTCASTLMLQQVSYTHCECLGFDHRTDNTPYSCDGRWHRWERGQERA